MYARSREDGTVRDGSVGIRVQGKSEIANWLFLRKWLVLKEKVLYIHKDELSSAQSSIALDEVTGIERVESNTKPYCLFLQTAKRSLYLSLGSDEELYGWLDDIYSRSPLIGGNGPTNFIHKIHVGFDPVSAVFIGLPQEWLAQLDEFEIRGGQRDRIEPHNNSLESTARDARTSYTYVSGSNGMPNPTSNISRVVRECHSVKIKSDPEGFAGGLFMRMGLVLEEHCLCIRSMNESPPLPPRTIELKDITTIERTDVRPHCLLLEAKGRTMYICLKNDEELYGWLDDIYLRSPLSSVSQPFAFIHKVHVGYDHISGAFSGVPEEWCKVLKKQNIAREDYAGVSQDMSKVANYFFDTDDLCHDEPEAWLVPSRPAPQAPQRDDSSTNNSLASVSRSSLCDSATAVEEPSTISQVRTSAMMSAQEKHDQATASFPGAQNPPIYRIFIHRLLARVMTLCPRLTSSNLTGGKITTTHSSFPKKHFDY